MTILLSHLMVLLFFITFDGSILKLCSSNITFDGFILILCSSNQGSQFRTILAGTTGIYHIGQCIGTVTPFVSYQKKYKPYWWNPTVSAGKDVSDQYKPEENEKEKEEKGVCDSLTWCLMIEIYAPNLSFFFLSIPFSNLDPIPLHCSYHCNFFILLLLLLLSCVFGFFTANALQLCAFSFVSFKFSYLIFSQWCQMVRWKWCGNLIHLLYIFCYFRVITCPSFFLFSFFFLFFFGL